MYIYMKTSERLYAIGFYGPGGEFVTEHIYQECEEAAERVHYLNGGIDPDVFNNAIEDLRAITMNLFQTVEDLNTRLDRVSVPL